jgi:hypothetical protein
VTLENRNKIFLVSVIFFALANLPLIITLAEPFDIVPTDCEVNYNCKYYGDFSISGNAKLIKINNTNFSLKIYILGIIFYESDFEQTVPDGIPSNFDDIAEAVWLNPNWTETDNIISQIVAQEEYYNLTITDGFFIYQGKELWLHKYFVETFNGEEISVYYFHKTGLIAFLYHPDMEIIFLYANFQYYERIIPGSSDTDESLKSSEFRSKLTDLEALIVATSTIFITLMSTLILYALIRISNRKSAIKIRLKI